MDIGGKLLALQTAAMMMNSGIQTDMYGLPDVGVNTGTGNDIKNLNKCKRMPKPKQFQKRKKMKNPNQYSKTRIA